MSSWHSVNSYWLFNTQSRVLQADWFISQFNEKATLNINKPYCWAPIGRFGWWETEYQNVIFVKELWFIFFWHHIDVQLSVHEEKQWIHFPGNPCAKSRAYNLSGQFIHLPKQGPAIRCRIFRVKICLSSIISVSLSINSHSRNKRYATAKTVNGRKVWFTASCVPNTRNNDEKIWCWNWNGTCNISCL